MKCPACGTTMNVVGTATYYSALREYRTPIEHCAACDVYGRDVNAAELVDHYHAASYVQLENEDRFRGQREGFFRYLVDRIDQERSGRRLLDFGSSYGHLLEYAQSSGMEVCGVELNEQLVAECNERGLLTVKSIEESPGTFDVITMIDSLYCVPNPAEILESAKAKLEIDGELIIRVTDRNTYARLINLLRRGSDFSTLGDATFSYSKRAVAGLLHRAGFDIKSIEPDYGVGKAGLGWKTIVYYRFSRIVGRLTLGRIDFAPGTIVHAVPTV